jgi:4-carboxymuconolactone decarboxylase
MGEGWRADNSIARRSIMRRLVNIACVLVVMAAANAAAQPRIAPLPESAWTDEHRSLVAIYAGAAGSGNDFRTLLRHPALIRGAMPFANYITRESTLPPRHRELLILRTAWLCRSEYLWSKHASRAAAAGLSAQDVARVSAGADAAGWDPFEAMLLRAADELHRASFISTPTWNALAARYSRQQLMDATFTIAELTMLAMTDNSVRVERDATFTSRMPDAPRPAPGPRAHQPLASPRVEPLAASQWTPEIRAMLDPSGSGRDIAAVYRTFAQHPKLYPPRQLLSEYIRTQATLAPRIREMLILRIGYLCGSAYEWAAHAPAGRRAGLTDAEIARLASPGYDGWNAADAAIVRAVDELYAEDVISDATWKALAAQFDERQLLDLLITTGGYRMVSMALNTFGVPAEPNSEPLPGRGGR